MQAVAPEDLGKGGAEVIGLDNIGIDLVTDDVGEIVSQVDLRSVVLVRCGNLGHGQAKIACGELVESGGHGAVGVGIVIAVVADPHVADDRRAKCVGQIQHLGQAGAIVLDISHDRRAGESIAVAIFMPRPPGEDAIEPGSIADVVIHTGNGHVVAILVLAVEDVVIHVAGPVGRGKQLHDGEPDRADPCRRDEVAGELLPAVGLAVRRRTLHAGGGQRIIDTVCPARGLQVGIEVDSAAGGKHVRGWHRGDHPGRKHLAVALVAEEEERVVPEERAANRAPELMLVVKGPGLVLLVELVGVGVEGRVAPEVIQGSVEVRGAVLDDGVDRSAADASILRVEGDRHHLELLYRVNAGRDVPGARAAAALDGDGRTIQHELVIGALLAGDGVGVRGIPPPRAGVAAGAELRLGEAHTRCQLEQHVDLPPVQGKVLHLLRIHHRAARGIRRAELQRVFVDRDRLAHRAHRHRECLGDLGGDVDDHTLVLDALEARRLGPDGVGAGLDVRDVEAALGVGCAAVGLLRAGRRHGGIGNSATLGIRNLAGDGASILLRGRRRAERSDHEQDGGRRAGRSS